MANPVMNYNQFMAAFKRAESGYRGKANVAAIKSGIRAFAKRWKGVL